MTEALDIIASIQTRIKQLAGLKILKSLDAQYKKKFNNRFPKDIPHTKDLPTSYRDQTRETNFNRPSILLST
jgi:hypothetical protein